MATVPLHGLKIDLKHSCSMAHEEVAHTRPTESVDTPLSNFVQSKRQLACKAPRRPSERIRFVDESAREPGKFSLQSAGGAVQKSLTAQVLDYGFDLTMIQSCESSTYSTLRNTYMLRGDGGRGTLSCQQTELDRLHIVP